jgi:hypothetical protein
VTGQDPAPFVVITPVEESTVQIALLAEVENERVPSPEVVLVVTVTVSLAEEKIIEFAFGYIKLSD